jgi:hypothetical protein
MTLATDYFTGRAEENYWRDLWRYRERFRVLIMCPDVL